MSSVIFVAFVSHLFIGENGYRCNCAAAFASALVTHSIFELLLSNLYTKAPTFVYYKWNQFKPLKVYSFVAT